MIRVLIYRCEAQIKGGSSDGYFDVGGENRPDVYSTNFTCRIQPLGFGGKQLGVETILS